MNRNLRLFLSLCLLSFESQAHSERLPLKKTPSRIQLLESAKEEKSVPVIDKEKLWYGMPDAVKERIRQQKYS